MGESFNNRPVAVVFYQDFRRGNSQGCDANEIGCCRLFIKGRICPRHWWGGGEANWQQTTQQQGWSGQMVELLEVHRRLTS